MRGKKARKLRKQHLNKSSQRTSFVHGKRQGTTVKWEGGRRDYQEAKRVRGAA